MLKEFKNFIMTGNVIDLAVAVILAGAVGAVVNGFVTDIMMPIVGHFSGGLDFSEYAIELTPATGVEGEAGYNTGSYIQLGLWINKIISLITVGFVLFMIVKAYNKTKKKKEEAPAAPPAPTKDQELLSEIRDLLKK